MFTGWRRTAVGLMVTVGLVGGGGVPAAAAESGVAATAEFIGYGLGRSAGIAVGKARTSARSQAVAAGFSTSQCVIVFEDAEEEKVDTEPIGYWIGESDIVCTN